MHPNEHATQFEGEDEGEFASEHAGSPDPTAGQVRSRPALVVAAIFAVAPIVVATARAVARGWMPISENALFELRARDVFTGDMPLLGTASSASITSGTALNHPGPLVFEWLAVPVRLFGGHAGVAIGVALLNIAVILIAGALARRVGGDGAAVAVLLGAGFVAWVMGSELLFDPWNPNVLMLSAYAFIVAGWALANGTVIALPYLAVLGSVCLQTHLSYVYLVPIVAVGAIVIGRPRPTRRLLAATSALLVVAWLPPVVEQIQHGRNGNLWGLARAGLGEQAPAIGVRLGTRLTGAVLTHRPWDARRGFATAVPPTGYGPDGRLPPIDTIGIVSAGVRLAILVGVLIALWRWARRRDSMLARTASFTLVVIFAAWFSVVRMPIGAIGLSPHQMRWLWSIAGWLVAVGGLATVTLIPRLVAARQATSTATKPSGTSPTATVEWALVVIVAVLALVNFGQYVQPAGPALVAWRIPSVASLTGQTVAALDAQPPDGAVWIDTRDIPYFDVYYQSVMTAVDEAGYEFQVDDAVQLRQVGPGRALDHRATVRLHLLYGLDAFVPGPDETVIATVSELPAVDHDRLDLAIDTVSATIDATGIALTPAGKSALAEGRLAVDPQVVAAGSVTADTTRLPIGDIVAAWSAGHLVADDALAGELEAIAELTEAAGSVIVVVISPIETGLP